MNKITEFWKSSYYSDPKAFILEMISFFVTVYASSYLAINASSPDMTIVYPFFFIGSVTAIWAYHRRKLVWPYMLTIYFAFVNVFGFSVAMGWY